MGGTTVTVVGPFCGRHRIDFISAFRAPTRALFIITKDRQHNLARGWLLLFRRLMSQRGLAA